MERRVSRNGPDGTSLLKKRDVINNVIIYVIIYVFIIFIRFVINNGTLLIERYRSRECLFGTVGVGVPQREKEKETRGSRNRSTLEQ